MNWEQLQRLNCVRHFGHECIPYTSWTPWQYDLQAVHRGRENAYEFSWKNDRAVTFDKTGQMNNSNF